MRFSKATAWAVTALTCLSVFPALAQEEAASGQLLFQLNNAKTIPASGASPEGCQLTFVIKNDTGVEIEKSSYNMAIVNGDGQVSTLITFEFKPLPVGRTKVQQFGLGGQSCENISAISINEFVECTGADGSALSVCEDDIDQSTKTSIQFPWELQ